jgi:3-hydroxyacyl-[acyl-carrier-protein] dehydratase
LKLPSADEAWSSVEHCFDPQHPTASGHFPGNPIIPGALLLDHVLRAIGRQASLPMPVEIQAAKFRRPVRPGDRVEIRWRRQASGIITFECRTLDGNEMALSGSIKALPAS